jgi:hypothetical protein
MSDKRLVRGHGVLGYAIGEIENPLIAGQTLTIVHTRPTIHGDSCRVVSTRTLGAPIMPDDAAGQLYAELYEALETAQFLGLDDAAVSQALYTALADRGIPLARRKRTRKAKQAA